MALFQLAERRSLWTFDLALPLRLVEDDGRGWIELIEDEQQRAQHHDEELHRDLEQGIEHQAQPALAERSAANVSLHLRLVGAEI